LENAYEGEGFACSTCFTERYSLRACARGACARKIPLYQYVAEHNQLMRIKRSLGDRAVLARVAFAHYMEAGTYRGTGPV
jgi:hypothetical protein